MSDDKGGNAALFGMFVVWYSFNAGYNVFNSKLKDYLSFPIAISALQLVVGLLYVVPIWVLGLRRTPKLNVDDLSKLFPIAFLNALGHTCTVIAMFQKGGGSFTHVIKASEPVVSVLLGLLINGVVPPTFTALSLLPITFGVAYASTLGNLDVETMSREFATRAAIMAMIGNVSFALRSILRKNLSVAFKEKARLDPANEHAVTTIFSAVLIFPISLLIEGPANLKTALLSMTDQNGFLLNLFICGMCFYIYNEVQNKVLGSLGPVTTAVGNTLKRVVIFVALFFFTKGETFPMPKIVGCAIAIAGCLSYAVCNSKKI